MSLTHDRTRVVIPESPDKAQLEQIPVDHPELHNTVVRFACADVVTLCPVTGEPDYARLFVDFVPDKFLVESESFEFFLNSFRSEKIFHEMVPIEIGTRLQKVLQASWLRVVGIWTPRGGVPIDVFWQTGPPPAHVFVPPLYMYQRG